MTIEIQQTDPRFFLVGLPVGRGMLVDALAVGMGD